MVALTARKTRETILTTSTRELAVISFYMVPEMQHRMSGVNPRSHLKTKTNLNGVDGAVLAEQMGCVLGEERVNLLHVVLVRQLHSEVPLVQLHARVDCLLDLHTKKGRELPRWGRNEESFGEHADLMRRRHWIKFEWRWKQHKQKRCGKRALRYDLCQSKYRPCQHVGRPRWHTRTGRPETHAQQERAQIG